MPSSINQQGTSVFIILCDFLSLAKTVTAVHYTSLTHGVVADHFESILIIMIMSFFKRNKRILHVTVFVLSLLCTPLFSPVQSKIRRPYSKASAAFGNMLGGRKYEKDCWRGYPFIELPAKFLSFIGHNSGQ